jgi:hypothetical protein
MGHRDFERRSQMPLVGEAWQNYSGSPTNRRFRVIDTR